MKSQPILIIKYLLIGLGVLILAVLAFLFIGWPQKTPNATYGITFSRTYAEQLGLDPDHVLQIALDDLGIRRFRIAPYWKLIEPQDGQWDFTQLDKDLDAITTRGGKVILAIGEKQPRWPECWGPDWWKALPRDDQRTKTLDYLKTVVTRYRGNPTIQAWQIENEPHFQYGDCPATDDGFFLQETQFIKALDPSRPITTTDSGELSLWTSFGSKVDELGISVYRVVRSPMFGGYNLRYWFVPPYLYARKATLLQPFGLKQIYVSEFQMEPWSNTDLTSTPIDDQLSSMDENQMRANFSFAERMGIQAIDFWGLEWWVWMAEKQGHPEFLEIAKAFYQSHRSSVSG